MSGMSNLGVTEIAVLRVLALDPFSGHVDDLADVVSMPVARVWGALARLGERGLIVASRLPEGDGFLGLRISRMGRSRLRSLGRDTLQRSA